jgi:tRNA(fMet)-specific endonuclease VapC
MIWMLDTNTLICLINRRPNFERVARRMSGRSPGELRMSAITVAELRYGIALSARADENEAALEELLNMIQADDFPVGAARDFGEIKATLSRRGRPIGPYDLLIAAHARHVGATLVTNNEREFRRVSKLAVQNWLRA